MTIVRKQELLKETSLQLLEAVKHAGFGTLKHMTHINNLESILEHGLQCHGNRYQKQDISNLTVNNRRTSTHQFYQGLNKYCCEIFFTVMISLYVFLTLLSI